MSNTNLTKTGIWRTKGSVPNPNLFLNADFHDQYTVSGWNTTKNGTLSASNWGGYNSGVANQASVYHAHLKIVDNEPVYEYTKTSDESWLGISQGGIQAKIVSGNTYTMSWEQYCVSGSNYAAVGLYYYKIGATSANFHLGVNYGNSNRVLGKWQKFIYTFTAPSDGDYSKSMYWYIYGHYGGNGTMYIRHPKLEIGSNATQFTLSTSEGYENFSHGFLETLNSDAHIYKLGYIEANQFYEI